MSEGAVVCHVGSDIRIPGLAAKPLERLRRALSFVNPAYTQAKRRGASTNGINDRIYALIEEPDGSARIPRGAVKAMRASFVHDGISASFVDERVAGDAIVVPKNDALDRARYYQRNGVRALTDQTQGLIVIPCGGGKTTIGVAAIGALQRAALIIVHTEDLLDQWRGAVRGLLGIEPGVIMNGEGDGMDRPVVIGMAMTLVRLLETDFGRQWCRRFGALVVDEAHHSPCETFQRALMVVPAKYRLGLTATPDREDGCEPLMDWSFGPRILDVPASELFAEGFLVKPKIEQPESDFRFEYGPRPENAPPSWDQKRVSRMQSALVADVDRNNLIRDIVARDVKAGEIFLVLSNNRAHCTRLTRLLWEAGIEPRLLLAQQGRAAKKARAEVIQGMREGKIRCAVATSLADEGLDVKPLSRVLLALPEKARGKTMQRIGRLMRPDGDKKPILYDVIDPHVETLVNRATERRGVYRDLGLL